MRKSLSLAAPCAGADTRALSCCFSLSSTEMRCDNLPDKPYQIAHCCRVCPAQEVRGRHKGRGQGESWERGAPLLLREALHRLALVVKPLDSELEQPQAAAEVLDALADARLRRRIGGRSQRHSRVGCRCQLQRRQLRLYILFRPHRNQTSQSERYQTARADDKGRSGVSRSW